ncbi:uncharacterized protein LOC123511539 [Portunus trituberculatus]|uniref:uncharacterized protein LOC123511539 n=1 Tax=Portunus trituberculatus TaxID=210409 RepID=UPI001E1CC926|nr:uncharacterized protein LOC123511539 [Portunus trituberculatus]
MTNFIFFFILVASFAKVRPHSTPLLSELVQQLHLTPGYTSNSQRFLLIPVQRPLDTRQKEKKRLVVETAQVMDTGTAAIQQDVGISVQITTDGKTESMDVDSLDEVFLEHDGYEQVPFSMQVPLVLPFDFRFKQDSELESPPECSTDARTWREHVINDVMNILELPGTQPWNLQPQGISAELRLKRDKLATLWELDFEDKDTVETFMANLKLFEDEAYNLCNIFNQEPSQVNLENLSALAECIYTYQFIQECVSAVRNAYATIDNPVWEVTEVNAVAVRVAIMLQQLQPRP